MKSFKALRSALLCGTAAIVIGLSAPVLAQTRSFDLPAQPAVSSIPMFAKQAGIQIVAPAGQLNGINTQAIHGDLDRKQALAKLLEGTGLTVSSDDGSVVILQLADKPKPAVTAPAPVRMKPEAAATEERPLDEVVVSGYRESLAAAHALKRDAVGTEDVIVAEDIAAFPDLNLAESLQRIPGITINRDSGEGRQITLRGLGPDFTRTQLNGMEVLGNTASGMDTAAASAAPAASITACSPRNCSTASPCRNPMPPTRMKAASAAPCSWKPPSRSISRASRRWSRPRARPTPMSTAPPRASSA